MKHQSSKSSALKIANIWSRFIMAQRAPRLNKKLFVPKTVHDILMALSYELKKKKK